MRFIRTRQFLICCLALAVCTGNSRAETPTQAVDRIWNAFTVLKSYDDRGAAAFADLSKKVANEQGVAVIDPIMTRSKDWKGDEVLVFVNLVCCLPSEKTIPMLKQYQKNGKPWERQCATDLLSEISASIESQKTVNVNVTIPGR